MYAFFMKRHSAVLRQGVYFTDEDSLRSTVLMIQTIQLKGVSVHGQGSKIVMERIKNNESWCKGFSCCTVYSTHSPIYVTSHL